MIIHYTFAEALALPIGTVVTASNGQPFPAGDIAGEMRWRGHNFTGTIVGVGGGQLDVQYVTDIAEMTCHLSDDGTYDFTVDSANISDPALVDASLTRALEASQEALERADMSSSLRRLAAIRTWAELTDVKLNQAAIDALSALNRAKRIPFLFALKQETGLAWGPLITLVEDRLWPVIQKTATMEAKATVAKINLANASTVQDKIAAAQVALE